MVVRSCSTWLTGIINSPFRQGSSLSLDEAGHGPWLRYGQNIINGGIFHSAGSFVAALKIVFEEFRSIEGKREQ